MPLMVDLDVQHETHCSTWLFCLCILDLNASDGGFRCATWNSLFNMAFLYVYTGIECFWWMNGWYSMLVDLEVQHETHCSTLLFCMCILELNASDEMHYFTWVFEAYAIKGICWMNGWYYMLVDIEVQHETHCSTWLFCTCILELNASDGWMADTLCWLI